MVVRLHVGVGSAADFDDRLDEDLIDAGTGDDDVGVLGFEAQPLAGCGWGALSVGPAPPLRGLGLRFAPAQNGEQNQGLQQVDTCLHWNRSSPRSVR